MPTHGDPEQEQEDNENGGPDGCGAEREQGQHVVHIHKDAVAQVYEAVAQADKEACKTGPEQSGCSGPKIEGKALVKTVAVVEAQEALVLRTDEDAAMCFADIQHQSGELLLRWGNWHASSEVFKAWVCGAVR